MIFQDCAFVAVHLGNPRGFKGRKYWYEIAQQSFVSDCSTISHLWVHSGSGWEQKHKHCGGDRAWKQRESRTTTTAVTKAAVKPRQERFMDIHLQAVSRETGGTRTTPPPFEVSLSSICLAQCFVSYETRSPGDCPSIQPLQSPFFWEKKSLRNNEVGHLIFVLFSSLLWSVNDLDSKKSVAVRRSFFKKESQSKFPRCQGVLSLLLSLEIVSFFV